MRLKKLNSNVERDFPVRKYLVDWDKSCRSKFQFDVKQWFKKYWHGQVCLEEFRIPGSRLMVDLVNLNKRALVEINGVQHDEFNKHFHRDNRENFRKQMERDLLKRKWANANNFTLIEILPEDLPLTLAFFRDRYEFEVI